MGIPNLSLTKIKLGDSANAANNFLISVPDTADGTLTIERENGTDVMTIDAAGKVVIPGNIQTWQDVTASRANNTDYINSTSLPIKVSVAAFAANADLLFFYVNGVVAQKITSPASAAVGVFVEVPVGATYRVVQGGTTPTIFSWSELR